MATFSAKMNSGGNGDDPSASRRVVILAYPGVTLLDLSGPAQAFTTATAIRAENEPKAVPSYDLAVASRSGGLIRTDAGIDLDSIALGDASARPVDTLVIPGGPGVWDALDDTELIGWIATQAQSARRVASVCIGAFFLGKAGLLNGRRVATHWRWWRELAHRHPEASVEPDPIFIRDGTIWSSAGISAGIDLALALVEQDLGRACALETARRLVVFLKRPGGQSQFGAALSAQTADPSGTFDGLHSWIADNLDADLRVEQLADRAGMSPRTFARSYTARTGVSPAKAVERLRVEAARRLLESADLSVGSVARHCGFGDKERMRRAFVRQLGVPPADYRGRFRLSG
jgi:transcriptional regulator GlxA family with amidase domain